MTRKISEIKDVISKVCTMLHVRENELTSNAQCKRVVRARRLISYHLVEKLGYSLSETGRRLNVHHSTVMYYVANTKRKLNGE